VNALRAKRDEDFAALEEGGMQVVSLEGEARANYLAAARSTTWERMRELMEASPRAPATTTADRAVLRSGAD
jgi:phage terminase large subunit GpA-like protein